MRPVLTADERARGRRLGIALRDARRGANLPLGTLSAQAGVAVDTIKRIESGRALAPTFWVVADLAQALDVDLAALARTARDG
jgi:transcriptional regulator with XRE-family HTH domain